MSFRVQERMLLDCNAEFIVYSLLSGFGSITEKERDATRFILGLLPHCMNDRRVPRISITNDAYTLTQLYLPELRVMASRHSYAHRGALKSFKQAQALLNIVVSPLGVHLSSEERKQMLGSIGAAEALLSNPLGILNELVAAWKIQHLDLFTNWRSLPIAGVDGYHFGVKLPVPLALEELLTPLPYPPKIPRAVWTRCEKALDRHAKSTPYGQTPPPNPSDFKLVVYSVSSRSVKKSEFEALDPRPQYFVLPDLTRTSSESSVSTDDCGLSNLSSNSPLLEGEVLDENTWDLVEDSSELGCIHHGGRVCCIYTGCRSDSGRAGNEHPKHGARVVDQWRRLLRRR